MRFGLLRFGLLRFGANHQGPVGGRSVDATRLTLDLLQSPLELSVGATEVFELEFHRSVFRIEIIDEVFESSVSLSHLLDIQLGDGSLAAGWKTHQQQPKQHPARKVPLAER